MIHDGLTNPPVMDAATARTILDTLDELGCGLSQRQIELKRKAKAALAYWASHQEGRAA
ncbi:hypothetical protein [Deinococcus sp. DB0503]|uniref:hypothetical protein n=1 Tax=Deinococcus sp. DB0503 TaxID=2479203 RepID=UPI0018E017C4|nr:hypothetical protein [Deinococcus sp. DB0503]